MAEALLTLLAFVGGTALVVKLVGGGLRFLLRAAEVAAAKGLADVSARRGDLTELAARRGLERSARARRRRDLLVFLLWLAWVAVPPFAGWMPLAYALAAPLWLLRSPALRRQAPPPA